MRAITRGRTRRLAAATAALAWLALGSAVAVAATPTTKPRVSTGGVTNVRGTTGQLDGVVNPENLEVSYFFEYGPTTAYGSKTKPATLPKSEATINVGQMITGLYAGEHYRLVVTWVVGGKTESQPGRDKQYSGGRASKLRFVIERGKEAQQTITYGETVELTGSITGKGASEMPLALQSTPFPYTTPFTTLSGTVRASRAGGFVFRVAGVHQNTEFRILTNTTRPLYSAVITVSVTPHVVLHVRSLGSGRYRFYGTVTPLVRNAVVSIQQLRPRKATSKRGGPATHSVATTALKRASSRQSRFSVTVSLTGTFHYQAYVKLARGPLASGASSHVLVHAPQGSSSGGRSGKAKKHRARK